MRIGEVAARAGVNVETLRYYERRGLLPEPARGPRGHRRYGEEAVRLVRAVKEAQGLGFTLAEIEELLAAPGAARTRVAEKIDAVDAELARLGRLRDTLARVAVDGDPSGEPLHVTNGDSVGSSLRRTSLAGGVLPWREVLNEGPVPALPPSELNAVRAAFVGAEVGDFDARDAALLNAKHVVLWFEHDLYDQLELVQILSLRHDDVELIQADAHLGPLDARELEALWPARRPVTDAQAALARAAWDAVRAPEPTAMEELVARDTNALPFLGAALRRWLEELPAPDTGLGRSERQALQLLAERPRGRHDLFVAAQALEEAPFDGDTWFFRRLDALAELVEGDAITDLGRDVLAGRADRVEAIGIDRWLGGTHLTRDSAWRWDGARVIRP